MEKGIITVRVDEDLKQEAMELFEDIGMSMSTAINIFLKQCVKEGKFPFELVKSKTSNAGRKIKPLRRGR
jgi:DNA-damage-inducible protein J